MVEQFIHAGIINAADIKPFQDAVEASGNRLIFLDSTFVLPSSEEDIEQNFKDAHIPGALLFDIKSVADKDSPLPHMVPDHTFFEDCISNLGITNNDVIVTYGQHGMIMGPARVWWMFKGFGHENIIVLNGGLPAWKRENLPTEAGETAALEKSSYKASPFNPEMITNMQKIDQVSQTKSCPILDARPAARFFAESPEPRAGMRSGHIPNSQNLPCSLLVDEYGCFQSREELFKTFQEVGLDLETENRKIYTSCGSGITACALTLALYHVGYQNVSVYDGSWSEWGLEQSPTAVSA